MQIDPGDLGRLSPEDRKRAAHLLADLEAARRENALAFYRPHPKQVVFHTSQAPLKAFLGGNRSGKTTAGIADDLFQAVDREVLPPELQKFKHWEPPFFCRVVTPDLTNTLEGVVLQKLREWTPKSQLKGGAFDKAWDKQLRILRFANGSWFQFFSNDQDLDKFGGAALHRIHYDEEPREDIYRECLMRLIDYGGDTLLTMTPLQGMSWTFDTVYERRDHEDVTVVTVDMDDNPHLDAKTKERVLSGLSPEERAARKEGRFVHFAGLVFPEFRPVFPFVIPERKPDPESFLIVGIDPGIRHMNAVVWLEVDVEGNFTVIDELAVKDAPISHVCDLIQMKNTERGYEPRWYVIDPASRNRAAQTGRSDQMEFADHGIVTIAGQNALAAGLHRIKYLLAHEEPKLRVCVNCQYLIQQFTRYRWATNSSRSENEAHEKPVKKDDHLLDALRYAVMSRPTTPERDIKSPFQGTAHEAFLRDLKSQGKRPPSSTFGPGIFA